MIVRRLLNIGRVTALLVVPLLVWRVALERSIDRDLQRLAAAGQASRAAVLARLDSLRPASVALMIETFGAHEPASRAERARRRSTLEPPPLAIPLLYALADLGGPDVVAQLIEALGDEHPDVRHYAAMTLAYIGAEAVPAVSRALLEDEDERRRTSAALILSLMGAPARQALPALETALADESEDVARTARYAIHQLSAGNEAFWDVVERARHERRPEEPR